MSQNITLPVTGTVVDPRRIRLMQEGIPATGPVLYWMSRDQRVQDNWALLFARDLALAGRVPLAVAFCLAPSFLGATIRQYGFVLDGLQIVERDLANHRIPFFLLIGSPETVLPQFVKKHRVSTVVTDFGPLRLQRQWKKGVTDVMKVPFYEVDAHNVVPCWTASPKLEYGAYTIRPKIHRLLHEFLTEVPPLRTYPIPWDEQWPANDWGKARQSLRVDTSVEEVAGIKAGTKAGMALFHRFVESKLADYHEHSNDPTADVRSGLSPYLHFGQVSAQNLAFELQRYDGHIPSQEAFFEQLVVRRELAENYCWYQPAYDTVDGFPSWAKETLDAHRRDIRPYLYGGEQLELAETHDDLWDAAQREMMITGSMPGYLRMYWAKKILEWTSVPDEAMRIAIYLNDKYQLDGRDPNGYTGIAWSIGGVHDRPWSQREIFGKIRYMSFDGCRRKFDVGRYLTRVERLAQERRK
jgi:deoxyribodipyrimidine photo-lyase